ncbi:hypothetical protein ACOBR2_02850 [Telmatobacter bradus]|uniref:hypothetical protein n=1 Tax=Telmatobacter bradus TaxID=474953 RepID=UPI003B434839
MAEINGKQKQAEAETNPAAERKIKKPSARKRQQEEKAVQDAVTYGIDALRKAVGKELIENGEKIAEKLRQKSAEGDVPSTKLLLALAKQAGLGKTLSAKKKSLALKLVAEREWAAEKAKSRTAEDDGKLET